MWSNCFVAAMRMRGCSGPGCNGPRCATSRAKAGGGLCLAPMRNFPFSYKCKKPKLASQRRIAFARMLSKTGSNSPGELEMTCSTSEVAVCRSSDTRSSLRRRVFSIAMTACATKLDSDDCRWTAFGITLCRCGVDDVDRLLRANHLGKLARTDRVTLACFGERRRHI